jgi:hypothetical protein
MVFLGPSVEREPPNCASDAAGTIGSGASSRFERRILPATKDRAFGSSHVLDPAIVMRTIGTRIDEEARFADDMRCDDMFSA